MKRSRLALYSFLLTLAVWLPVSWPLPAMLGEAISVGVMKRSDPNPAIVNMMPGDHLQFLYYMWIFSDFISGHTPFFYNLYEFNTGSDAERFRPGSYYFPFSLLFSAFYAVSNRALAWNLICFLVLWLSAYATWRFCRRYTNSEALSALGALVALLFPYQWVQLYGGSPAGFGMTLIPVLLLGLDRAVRDDRMTGGWWAGAALLFASMTDTHAFFFGVLLTPCWCVIAFTQRASFRWKAAADYGRLARALAPVVLLTGLAYWQTQLGTRHIKQSHTGGGRSVSEVALHSPRPEGLWSWTADASASYHIYFGSMVAILLLSGGLIYTALWIRRRNRTAGRTWLLMAMVLGLVASIVLLALGPFGPFDGRLFNAARAYIPQYDLIRQCGKIFLVLPALLALGVALTLAALRDLVERRTWAVVVALMAALLATEYYLQTKLLISRIDHTNEAYAAVASDAGSHNVKPHVLVIPLWPGDTHYTAIYQHYVSLYRVRMINGYRPFVPQEYIEEVFYPLRSLNHGNLQEDQVTNLTARGIRYLILHEDVFPERVSPFPVTVTLRRLLEHPHLTLLKQDGPVWAFRIEDQAVEHTAPLPDWSYYFPARRYEAERLRHSGEVKKEDGTAGEGRYVEMESGDQLGTKPLFSPSLPDMRWLLRVRGQGRLLISNLVANAGSALQEVAVNEDRWRWIGAATPAFTHSRDVTMDLQVLEGRVDVDQVKLAAGPWPAWTPGDQVTIPAPCFFHAGAIDVQKNVVTFRPRRDRSDLILYGPKLPLEPGRYAVSLELESPAEAGTRLGTWIMACPDGEEVGRLDLLVGQPAEAEITIPKNLPFLGAFLYAGTADVDLQSVTIRRLAD